MKFASKLIVFLAKFKNNPGKYFYVAEEGTRNKAQGAGFNIKTTIQKLNKVTGKSKCKLHMKACPLSLVPYSNIPFLLTTKRFNACN